jgi:hypothetical protein
MCFGFPVFAASELRTGTMAFQWQTPFPARWYCGRLTLEEVCELKGNTRIEMWKKEESPQSVCTE